MNRSKRQPASSPWLRLSMRTLLLSMLGGCMLLALFTQGASSAVVGHSILVVGFAIPGASWGYDITRSSRGAVIGLIATATLGTLVVSASVLCDAFFVG